MSEFNWEARVGLYKATVTLQRCKGTNGILPKSDSSFTWVYRKCRNLTKRRELAYTKRQFLYMGVKEITESHQKVTVTLHGRIENVVCAPGIAKIDSAPRQAARTARRASRARRTRSTARRAMLAAQDAAHCMPSTPSTPRTRRTRRAPAAPTAASTRAHPPRAPHQFAAKESHANP